MRRRDFLIRSMLALGGACLGPARADVRHSGSVTLFLSGDVMLGRGIDQIQTQSTDPRLYEPALTDARQYIALATAVNGPIPRRVDPMYVWGDALDELAGLAPDVRIVNLENAVTARGAPSAGKYIHYRTHPDNVAVLSVAGIDVCVLANNHVLDWGPTGLSDTLQALARMGVRPAGAGLDLDAARAPAIVPAGDGRRVKVVGMASMTSGVPTSWRAGDRTAGVHLIADDPREAVASVRQSIGERRPGDIVVVSIHWGANWGHEIPVWQRRLAHRLIDTGAVDVIHGHSAHHPKGVEVYRGKLVLYGCGDLINDYEGIRGHEAYRSEVRAMYFASLDPDSGDLRSLRIVPMRAARFRLRRATPGEAVGLVDVLNREGRRLGTRFAVDARGRLVLTHTARCSGGSGACTESALRESL